MGIGKVVELTPKRTENASACLTEDYGYALHRKMADSKPPKASILRMRHGIHLVTNTAPVPEDIGVGLDVKEISGEVLQIIDALRELIIAYRFEQLCRTNAASSPTGITDFQFLDDRTSKIGSTARNQ